MYGHKSKLNNASKSAKNGLPSKENSDDVIEVKGKYKMFLLKNKIDLSELFSKRSTRNKIV
jgi:hypothetical protein